MASSPSQPASTLRALTGIKPTGTPHLGNYLGMIRPAVELSRRCEAFYFIADYHALTTLHDAEALRRHRLEIAACWLACGLDPERTILFNQSDVPEVCEIAWMLSCVTGLGLLQRAHAFKDAQARNRDICAGTFFYPVLMAADILAYDSTGVPVGRDQKQHVEMARDMALMFNGRFGDCLVLPEPLIRDEVALIKGADAQKMSKSYGNVIPLFASARDLKKQIMQIVTDPTPLEEPKDPERCTVFSLYKHFATPEEVEALAARYRAGNFGYGHAKLALIDVMERELAGPRERFASWMASPSGVEEILREGGFKARKIARCTLDRMRSAAGF